MKNRLKKLRLGNGIPNSLAIWQELADFLEVPVEYLMGWIDNRATITINDLNPAGENAYERITDILNQEYPQACPEFNWSKIGQLLINSDITEG